MRKIVLAIVLILVLALGLEVLASSAADANDTHVYLVVFEGQEADDGSFDMSIDHATALSLVASAGGTVTADLTAQIGVLVVESDDTLFADLLRESPFVEDVGESFTWKAIPTVEEAEAAGLVEIDDPGEALQWSMAQIRTPEAHSVETGRSAVDVGILDTGIDGTHVDFVDADDGSSNIDCERGRDFVALGPGIGTPDPCIDNGFHGTHVAGIVAARANGLGVVGVAPDVTLVPVKVCDTPGYCYASSVVAGITYAGDARLDVVNMSFFVDDDELLESTEFKCMDDAQQRAFRRSVERAVQYARGQGVTPVAALGNSDTDVAHQPDGNQCEVVPAETSGVVGTMALGPESEKAFYSNYGSGATDVAAPGGSGTTGDCTTTVISTFPGNTYGCIQGTSMASPHAAGVTALIVSRFGAIGADGDVEMSPSKVATHLEGTSVDIGLDGYDECFGHGRIDALRAVEHDTSNLSDDNPPCPEYDE